MEKRLLGGVALLVGVLCVGERTARGATADRPPVGTVLGEQHAAVPGATVTSRVSRPHLTHGDERRRRQRGRAAARSGRLASTIRNGAPLIAHPDRSTYRLTSNRLSFSTYPDAPAC